MIVHLCLDCRLIDRGGIGTYIKSLLSHLSQGLYTLSLLAFPKDSSLLRPYSGQLIPMNSPLFSASEQYEYVRKIPPCDLFWAPHFNIPLFPIRAKKRITTIHDVYHLAFPLPPWKKITAHLAYNSAFALSDLVVTVSNFSKKEILKRATIAPKNLHVIPNVLDFIPSENRERGEFILAVGQLKRHKNFYRLVQAYKQLRPKEKLYIVGRRDGFHSFDEELLREIENDSFLKHHVTLMGAVSEEKLKGLYAAAEMFVFPSLYEGFGYPPLEAMASGCPVVAADCGAIPEVCHDAAEYVDPLSIDSIAAGMARVLGNPERREDLVARGRAVIEKKREQKKEIIGLIDACCCCP